MDGNYNIQLNNGEIINFIFKLSPIKEFKHSLVSLGKMEKELYRCRNILLIGVLNQLKSKTNVENWKRNSTLLLGICWKLMDHLLQNEDVLVSKKQDPKTNSSE